MIIARIDNQITSRTPYRRGRSFKGVLRYLLRGPRDAPDTTRVVHAETLNIWSDLDEAAHTMAATWQHRFQIMQAAGLVPRNGADNKAPVYHLVMSWTPEEEPPPYPEMAEQAKQLLHLLGLSEHEAVIVGHADTENPHVHIVVNTVHPLTGRTAPLRYDKRVMQGFAARYEDLRGQIVCKGRFAPDIRGAFNAAAGHGVSRRRDSRPRWARAAEPVREAKRAALPSVVLDTLTRHDATFTPAKLAQAVTASTVTAHEFSDLMGAIMASPELVRLTDDHGRTRYTTRTQKQVEARLARSALSLAGAIRHPVPTAVATAALDRFEGPAQAATRAALSHLLDERGLSVVVGYAGAGKSTLLKSAADAWYGAGYRLRGLALAGRAAESLEADSGIPSGTIAGFVLGLDNGVVRLSNKDIIVIDEAGMVASRQLDRVLHAAATAGAKVVLVGDPEQLQAIEAGGPFRYIVEHYDHARLTTVWRQKQDWMRKATEDLAEARTETALAAYEAAGMVQEHATQSDAVASMLDMWLANRERGLSQLMLTATNADARVVNAAARARLKALGTLGPETLIETEEGPLPLAIGDRLVFRRNDKTLAVKNGTTGTVTELAGQRLAVTIDGTPVRVVTVDVERYPHIAHGYAVTIHKAQGATVDRAYVLAAPNMDRHSTYVALSRHRDRVSLLWSREVFRDRKALSRALARERLKDMTLDYKEAIAARLRPISAAVRKHAAAGREIDAWTHLYAAQRAEAARIDAMSPIRRSFWYAANLARFVTTGAITLGKLHEKERARLARDLRRSRSVVRSTSPTQATDARPFVPGPGDSTPSTGRRTPPQPPKTGL